MAAYKSNTPSKHGPNFRHGYFGTATYRAWAAMIQRCTNPKGAAFRRWYGGQGIKVHPPWAASFTAFLRDVGPRPGPDLSLDRYPDPKGNYEPGNVRWATKQEQALNRRPRCRHVRKTHCKQGHEFTPENTLIQKSGKRAGRRNCKTCSEVWHRKSNSLRG